MLGAAERWRVPPGAQYEWRHFEDESALFNSRSGLTHFVSAVGAEALGLLFEQALSTEALTVRLMERCEIDDPAAFALQVERLIVQLCDLDLIERAPNHAHS